MVCRRSAQSSGQWVGQRRLCKEYMAGIEASPPKHQTIGAASAVETRAELYSASVKGVSRRLAILVVISHPVRKSCSSRLSIRPSTLAKVLFFVCKMLDF